MLPLLFEEKISPVLCFNLIAVLQVAAIKIYCIEYSLRQELY